MTTTTPDTKASKAPAARTKTAKLLALLSRPTGATIAQMTKATGWQAHSVRGFLSGTVKKKLGHKIQSEAGKDGRIYRVTGDDR